MDLIEGIETRCSTRAFKNTPVPEETLKEILDATANSPSYTNTQPWEVAVVCGEKRDELSRMIHDLAVNKAERHPDIPTPTHWPPDLDARAREHGARRLAALSVGRDDAAEREKLALMNFEFYGAPCAVFVFIDGALNEWSVFDAGLFSQSLILAAHAFGVGSCLQASVTGYSREIKQFLGIGEDKKLVIGIALGYPDAGAKLNTYRALKQNSAAFTRWSR